MISKLTDLEVDEYHRQGQELYRQHKYQAALQRFNAVIIVIECNIYNLLIL